MTTVQRIKQLAREQGRSISYLCKQLGFTSRTYFNDIEKNHREIPLDKLEVIARTLGVTVDYLLGKEKKPSVPEGTEDMGENEKRLFAIWHQVPDEQKPELLNLIEAALRMRQGNSEK